MRVECSPLKDSTLIVAHFYQKDEVYALADFTGDSLELAKKSYSSPHENIVFCGVGFMGQSVKILNPKKRVYMPNYCHRSSRVTVPGYFIPSIPCWMY